MRAQRGFTLLEVLMALSLLSVLVVIVYTGMRMGLSTWDAVQVRSEAAVMERTTRNWLRRQITALVPMQWREGQSARIAFAGDSRGFRFLGHRQHATRGGGLYLVELRNQTAAGVQHLVLGYQPRAADRLELAGVGEPELRRLGGAFKTLSFDYFGAPDERSPARWRPLWPSQATHYPALIRVRGTRLDERPWPDLVVAVRSAPTATGLGG